jgi:membrane-associated protease RseP (regulator of RpoE activity)
MRLVPRIHASYFYWLFVSVLGAVLFLLSSEAHAPRKALEMLPVMHVIRAEDAIAQENDPAPAEAVNGELPQTSVIQAAAPAAKHSPQAAMEPHALEAQVRDQLTRQGFPNLGVSAGRDGAVYVAGTLFDNSEIGQVESLLRKNPHVTDVHFTEIHMRKPSGHAYFGTETGSTRDGVEVVRVFRGSPAEAAGIRKGDVIVSFASRLVKDADTFRDMVRGQAGGARVPVLIVRGHNREVREVRLGQAAEMAEK